MPQCRHTFQQQYRSPLSISTTALTNAQRAAQTQQMLAATQKPKISNTRSYEFACVSVNRATDDSHYGLGNRGIVVPFPEGTKPSSVVCFLLGNSPASEFYMPTFWNTLSVPSSQADKYEEFFIPSSCVLLLVLSCLVCNCCWLTVCIVVVVLCVLLSYVYLLYYVGIAVFLLQMPNCWLEVSIRKVLRTAISTQVFLGFAVSKSKC